MSGTGRCSLGLLTAAESPNCLSPLVNDILCGVELCFGILIICRLSKELLNIGWSMRIMLSCYLSCLVCVCMMCCLGLAHVDEKTVVHYVLWTLAHVCYAFGIATRMYVFVRVVYNASRQKIQFNSSPFSISIFAVATIFSSVIIILWAFSPLYTTPESLLLEQLRRAGFIVWGIFTLIMSTSLFFVSRFVIGLYVGLLNNSDPSEKRRREKGASILKHMTAAACGAMFFSSFNYFLIGAIPGALRNEVAHAQFWLVEIAMLPLIRFLRQCAEIRTEQSKRESKRESSRNVKNDEASSSSAPSMSSNKPSSTVGKLTAIQLAELAADQRTPRSASQIEDERIRRLSSGGPLRLSVGNSSGAEWSDGRLSIGGLSADFERSIARPSTGLLIGPGTGSARPSSGDSDGDGGDGCKSIRIELP